MATNNNLGDLLQSIANAIKAKKGTTAPINAQDFPAEIESIQSGGTGGVEAIADALATQPYLEVDRYDWFMELEAVLLPGFDYFQFGALRFYYRNGAVTSVFDTGYNQVITNSVSITYSETILNGVSYPTVTLLEGSTTYNPPDELRIEYGYEY